MQNLPFDVPTTKALIFDMDGTVTHNIPYHDQSWVIWAEQEGLKYTKTELLAQAYGTIGEITRRLFPDATPHERFERGERKEAIYRDLFRPHLAPLPGLIPFLEWARQQPLSTAIATAGDATNIAFTVDGLQIRKYFDVFLGSEDVAHGKPNPEVYLLTAQRLEVDPRDCVAFEDSPPGVEAVRRAGMKCVVVNPMASREEYGDCSHVIKWMKDYSDLS
ncbi:MULTISPECIES: HAD family hydrolase [unclassified Schlesneria]|uniref:HAD family hydrolase n=1 Tax=Schlesneria TaxID=656899 RepID=UPI0035A141D5